MLRRASRPAIRADRAAREALVDALVRDGYRAHYALRGERLNPRVAEAAALLATVTGQDIEETSDAASASWRALHRIGSSPRWIPGPPRPQTATHGFDGYKAMSPSTPTQRSSARPSEPGSHRRRGGCPRLLEDLVPGQGPQAVPAVSMATAPTARAPPGLAGGPRADADDYHPASDRARRPVRQRPVPDRSPGRDGHLPGPGSGGDHPSPSRWWAGPVRRRVQPLPAARCLHTSVRGRVVAISPREAELTTARARQRDPAWRADYRATRPKVERKLAHLLRRRHGGRRARVRGLVRVTQDFRLLAAAVNLARLATLGLRSTANGWQLQPA
jgi:Transposase DDE domain